MSSSKVTDAVRCYTEGEFWGCDVASMTDPEFMEFSETVDITTGYSASNGDGGYWIGQFALAYLSPHQHTIAVKKGLYDGYMNVSIDDNQILRTLIDEDDTDAIRRLTKCTHFSLAHPQKTLMHGNVLKRLFPDEQGSKMIKQFDWLPLTNVIQLGQLFEDVLKGDDKQCARRVVITSLANRHEYDSISIFISNHITCK